MKLSRFLKAYRAYETGKVIYNKILKPVYEELRKDAYALDEEKQTNNRNRKRKPRKSNVVNKKTKRSHQRKSDT